MYMAYSNNPNLPRVRYEAVRLVQQGWSVRKTARHLGFAHNTVLNWLKQKPEYGAYGGLVIPTLSARPHTHPRALPPEIVEAILENRRKKNRCAEVVHQELQRDGIFVSLSSVKRTLKRHGCIRPRSLWKRWHFSDPRPVALNPGDLVQLDTIHIVPRRYESYARFYVYTLLDVFSRWAWARVYARPNTHNSVWFVKEAQRHAPFSFSYLQSDHGSEFSAWFTENVKMQHRHSRVRKPNDNAHVERFNRTIQEECLRGIRPSPEAYQEAIRKYLPYYNGQRLHLGINFQTPVEVVRSY
jgi:transposase InsO family protein